MPKKPNNLADKKRYSKINKGLKKIKKESDEKKEIVKKFLMMIKKK